MILAIHTNAKGETLEHPVYISGWEFRYNKWRLIQQQDWAYKDDPSLRIQLRTIFDGQKTKTDAIKALKEML